MGWLDHCHAGYRDQGNRDKVDKVEAIHLLEIVLFLRRWSAARQENGCSPLQGYRRAAGSGARILMIKFLWRRVFWRDPYRIRDVPRSHGKGLHQAREFLPRHEEFQVTGWREIKQGSSPTRRASTCFDFSRDKQLKRKSIFYDDCWKKRNDFTTISLIWGSSCQAANRKEKRFSSQDLMIIMFSHYMSLYVIIYQ